MCKRLLLVVCGGEIVVPEHPTPHACVWATEGIFPPPHTTEGYKRDKRRAADSGGRQQVRENPFFRSRRCRVLRIRYLGLVY
jgi:hypothetical protein